MSKPVPHPPLKVKASVPRRYRGGLAFGAEPVTIDAGTLTEDQLKAIISDPFLGVTELADEKKKAKPSKLDKDEPPKPDAIKDGDSNKKGD